MKKIITAALAMTLCMSMTACGDDDGSNKDIKQTTTGTSTTATETVTTTATTTVTTDKKTKSKTTKKAEKDKEKEKETEEETEAQTEAEAEEETEAEAQTEEETEVQTEAETEPETEAVPSGGSFGASDLYVSYGGYSLTVHQDISTFMAASSVDSSPSCYYEGDDKIFHYGDMDVYTYPVNGVDYVLDINIISSSVSTAKGLTVGMTLDDAIAMYGQGTDGGSMYTWYGGGGYMYVTYSGGVITSIGIAAQN